ncbi:MAG TPA: Fur family transcriptional regulator [Gammaproteobacteria bacterium]|nr:Fur family transcriptional regulator [Gammaproteobacteria bacterium]
MITQESVAKRLSSHGAKPTTQRLKLAEVVFARPQHLSAEQVLQVARTRGIRVSKATVYNTLNLFVDCGLLRELVVDRDRVYYDSTVHAHHHFYNVDTGEMIDIPAEAVSFAGVPAAPAGTEQDGVEVIIRVRNRS